jgi:CheY-like chemotaxis protein
MNRKKPITILVVDDDDDDRLLAGEAFVEARLVNDLRFVSDGEELMDYLYRRGAYSDPCHSPRPGLILLDLNMPKKSGYEALEEIKADPNLRRIPIVVLTTSKAKEDILRTYDLGVSGFITKPLEFEPLVDILRTLCKYWFKTVELPANGS